MPQKHNTTPHSHRCLLAGGGKRDYRRRDDLMRECKNAQEFSYIMWDRIKPYGWSWKKDVRPWLASVFGGVKFGDPAFDWSPDAARELADTFLSEATTW